MVIQRLLKCGKTISREYQTLKTLPMSLQSGTQHRLQGELSRFSNAHVFFCFVDITSSKAAIEQGTWPDCISAEHLLDAGESLSFFFSELFNMCFVHVYVAYPIPV